MYLHKLSYYILTFSFLSFKLAAMEKDDTDSPPDLSVADFVITFGNLYAAEEGDDELSASKEDIDLQKALLAHFKSPSLPSNHEKTEDAKQNDNDDEEEEEPETPYSQQRDAQTECSSPLRLTQHIIHDYKEDDLEANIIFGSTFCEQPNSRKGKEKIPNSTHLFQSAESTFGSADASSTHKNKAASKPLRVSNEAFKQCFPGGPQPLSLSTPRRNSLTSFFNGPFKESSFHGEDSRKNIYKLNILKACVENYINHCNVPFDRISATLSHIPITELTSPEQVLLNSIYEQVLISNDEKLINLFFPSI